MMSRPGDFARTDSRDDSAHLRSVAERIHRTADDLPISTPTGYGSGLAEDLEDQIRSVTELLTYLANAVAVHSRAVAGGPRDSGATAQRKIGMLTRAAGPVGQALADLAEAVTQVGFLYQIAGYVRSAERDDAMWSAHAVFDDRVDSARDQLHEAARDLQRDAELLIAPPPTAQPAPTLPAAKHVGPPPAPPAATTLRNHPH